MDEVGGDCACPKEAPLPFSPHLYHRLAFIPNEYIQYIQMCSRGQGRYLEGVVCRKGLELGKPW